MSLVRQKLPFVHVIGVTLAIYMTLDIYYYDPHLLASR
jgi:hypothetical protein